MGTQFAWEVVTARVTQKAALTESLALEIRGSPRLSNYVSFPNSS